MNAWRRLNFVAKFFVVWLGLGLAAALVQTVTMWVGSRQLLAQVIRPVRFENAELGPALQQLVDSTQPSLRLSMCPDVAARRVTLTTTTEMPLKDFVVLLAGKVGAEVDLARHRHGGGTPYPHLYFAAAPCPVRSSVYAFPRERTARTPAASADPAGTSPSPRSPSPP
jgi:hypothetical protein